MFNYFCPNAVSAFDKSKNICYNIIKENIKGLIIMLYIIIGLLTGVIYTTYKWYKTYNEYIEYKEKIIREHQMIKEKFAELKNATETYEKTNDSYSRLNKNEPWRILSECNVIQQVAYNVENSYVITDFSELENRNVVMFCVGINEAPPPNVETFEMGGKRVSEKFFTNCVVKDFGNNYYTWEPEEEWESHNNWKDWHEIKEEEEEDDE